MIYPLIEFGGIFFIGLYAALIIGLLSTTGLEDSETNWVRVTSILVAIFVYFGFVNGIPEISWKILAGYFVTGVIWLIVAWLNTIKSNKDKITKAISEKNHHLLSDYGVLEVGIWIPHGLNNLQAFSRILAWPVHFVSSLSLTWIILPFRLVMKYISKHYFGVPSA